MTTESFPQFINRVEQTPLAGQNLIAQLVFEAKQGGRAGAEARMKLRAIPGGSEALIAATSGVPQPVAPPSQLPQPVAPRDGTAIVSAPAPPPPAPVPATPPPPPPSNPSLFDQTIGRGIGALGRGALGFGRFIQPVTDPILGNLGKAIETTTAGTVSTVGALTPGDLLGLESKLAEERAKRGVEPRLPGFLQATPLGALDTIVRGDAARELQAQAAAWRATDMPSTRVNVLPGQGIPLPGGKRLDEVDVGVKGALELLPEVALGIATGGSSATGGLARRAATSTANVLGADVAMAAGRGAVRGARGLARGAQTAVPSGSAARGVGGVQGVGTELLPRNQDGTVTLFHGTTPEGGRLIRESGTLIGKEDGVFLTTDRDAALTFGNEIVEVKVNPARLAIDDEFPTGRQDFRISAQIGEPVEVDIVQAPTTPARQADAAARGVAGSGRLREIRTEIQQLMENAQGGNQMTAEQADQFRSLMREADEIRFDIAGELDPSTVQSSQQRLSRLTTDEVITARNSLTKNKDLFLAISEAAAGTFRSAETVLDDIVRGVHESVTPQQFYDTFTPIREQLRSKYGETIPLFRAVGEQIEKPTTNWASTREGAARFGDNIVQRDVPIDDIWGVNVGLNGNYEEFIISSSRPPRATSTPARQADVVADVETQQLKFDFIDEPDISPTTGKVSAADEAFEVNQTKAVELPEAYSPGLIDDLVPKIISPDVIRRSLEKTKKILKAIPGVNNAQFEPSTLVGMAVSRVIKAAPARISSTSNRLTQDVRGLLTKRNANGDRIFEFSDDDMRIENIADKMTGTEINPRTGKPLDPRPTVADLAQDYGAYENFLTTDQIQVMESLRVRAEGLAADLEQFGFQVEYKAQLGDKGFFISRGPTKQELDARVSGQPRSVKESYQKRRATDENGIPYTQSELIDQGSEYLPVWDEFGQWSTEIYESILQRQIDKFIKGYKDPTTGERIALSTRELAGELSVRAQQLRAQIAAAKKTFDRQKVRLSEKQKQYVREFKKFETYTNKLSDLKTKLAETITDKELQTLIRKERVAAEKLLDRAEKVLQTRQARTVIAKLNSDVLRDQLDNLEKFEEYQKQLLNNASQRLEAQQLSGASKNVITRSEREANVLEDSLNRAKKLRERTEGLYETARKREEAADIAEAKAQDDVTVTRKDFDETEIPQDVDVEFAKANGEFRKFKVEVTARRKSMDQAGKRLGTEKAKIAETELKISRLQDQLESLRQDIDKATEKAKEGKSRANSQFRTIRGDVWMNSDDLKTIERSLEGMQRTSGRAAKFLGPISAYQNVRRALGATLDDSGVSIQGKLSQFSNPKEFLAAYKAHLQSLIGKPGRKGTRLQRESMADNLRAFDEESISTGAPSSHEIIDRMGIRFGGVDTEVTLRPEGITGSIGRLPLIRRANEAFGAFGDMLRLKYARAEIMEYMRLSGKTFDELVADGTARKIGNGVNGITGWTPNGVAGVFGDMLLFAPRFFRARIETLHRAMKGMDVDFLVDALPFDRQIRRNLNINYGIRNNIDADQLIARRAVMKLVSMGTLITVAANEILGQETDFQLMKNGRLNPNFMSVRLTKLGAPRDWNIFGPYKSLAALILATGGAGWEKDLSKAIDAWGNLASPIAGDVLEFMNFQAYGESRFGETLSEYIMESHIPFSLQEIPSIVKGASTGNPKDAFGGGLSIGLELVGEQSSALSRSDILQDFVRDLYKSGTVSANNYDDLEPYEKNDVKDSLVAELEKFEIESAATGKPLRRYFATVDIINRRRDSMLQEALIFFNAGQRSDGSKYTSREFIDDYFDILDDARERKEQVEETLGIEWKDKVIADDDLEAKALQAWNEAPSKSLTAAGNYLPERVKVLRNKVLQDYPEQVDYILRNTNDTPLPQGFLEALERAGLKSTVENIRKSEAARLAQGAPPKPSVPSETLITPEQPVGVPQVTSATQQTTTDVPADVLRTRQLLAP